MKRGFTNSLQSQTSSQLSGQQQVKAVQSDQRRKHQQARFWPLYFGMCKVFCSLIILKKEKPSIANIIQHCWCIWRKKLPQNGHKWRRKKWSFTKTMNCHKLIAMMAKLHELHFELLPHLLYSLDLAPNNFRVSTWKSSQNKRMKYCTYKTWVKCLIYQTFHIFLTYL